MARLRVDADRRRLVAYVSAGNGLFTLLGFMGLYALLAILFLFLIVARNRPRTGAGVTATDAPGTGSRETSHGNDLVLARRAS